MGQQKLVPKYFAVNGSPIEKLGTQTVNAVLENGMEITTIFDVGKITRPLLSVHMMIEHERKPARGRSIVHAGAVGPSAC